MAAVEDKDATLLRDRLAIDRTALANERTLLSYVRTCLTLLAGGATLLKFFDGPAVHATAIAALVIGTLVGALGLTRFVQMSARLRQVRNALG